MCWNQPADAMSQSLELTIEMYGLSARCSDIGREPFQAADHAGLEAMCGRGEMVDAADSKSAVERHVGSSPTARTTYNLLCIIAD